MADKKAIRIYKGFKIDDEYKIPAVYSAIAIALHEGQLQYEHIAEIFARSQEIWEEHKTDNMGMLIRCYNETGIQLMSEEQFKRAEKMGLIKPEEFENQQPRYTKRGKQ